MMDQSKRPPSAQHENHLLQMNMNEDPDIQPSEKAGMPNGIIADFLDLMRAEHTSLHALIIYHAGKIVFADGWQNHTIYSRHDVYSVSKAFTATAVGLLVDSGQLSTCDPVATFFPEYADLIQDDRLKSITIEHLLNMKSGHGYNTFDRWHSEKRQDWLAAWFSYPLNYQPGSFFTYDAGLTYILGRVIQRITGRNVKDYLQERLFAPLGITGATWEVCPLGFPLAGMGLNISAFDLLKFCVLYLQEGIFAGQRVVSKDWVNAVSLNSWTSGRDEVTYNYQFGLDPPDIFTAAGAFGQFGIIAPSRQTVIITMAGDPEYWKIKKYLVQFVIPQMDCLASASSRATTVAERQVKANGHLAFQFNPDDSALRISRMQIDWHDQIKLTVSDERGDHELIFSERQPIVQSSKWFVREQLLSEEQIAADYVRISANILALNIKFLETAYELRLRLIFADPQLHVIIKPNLSVERVGYWLRMPIEGIYLASCQVSRI